MAPARQAIHRREHVIARTQREFELLDAAIGRLSLADWDRPVPRRQTRDPWTIKDALAHLTYWKEHHARSVRKERQPPWGDDVNARNRHVYELWRDRASSEVVAYHRTAHVTVMRTLAEAPDEWFSGRTRGESWPADLVGHVAEHRVRDIERALSSK